VVDDVDVDDVDEVLDVELGSVVEVLDVDELDVDELDVDVLDDVDVDDELVVGDGIDVVTNGGRVVGTTPGTVVVLRNGGFVVDVVVDDDDVLDDVDDVDDVELDDEVVMMMPSTGGAGGGRNGSVRSVVEVSRSTVDGGAADVVVVSAVVDATHDERGTRTSGSCVSVPSLRPPIARASVTMPPSMSNAPADAAARFACRRHQGSAYGAYSSSSSASLAHSSSHSGGGPLGGPVGGQESIGGSPPRAHGPIPNPWLQAAVTRSRDVADRVAWWVSRPRRASDRRSPTH
jgi:hypothetical protein